MSADARTNSALHAWLVAMRLRTLPLAAAAILMGTALAAATDSLRWSVAVLCLITALLLQILSNLANDYGDAQHGADSGERSGPLRAVQSGLISAQAMRRAIGICAALCLLAGGLLLWLSLGQERAIWLLLFALLGIAAIGAAITYTSGFRPYGYVGLGDLSVLIFFGWAGVLGSYFLQAQRFDWLLLLPASACGLLAVAVLNVNNIRDIDSDGAAGKHTIPVRLGPARARQYHWLLLLAALAAAVIYVLAAYAAPWNWLFLLAAPLLVGNGRRVAVATTAASLNLLLKQTVQLALVFVALFSLGQVL